MNSFRRGYAILLTLALIAFAVFYCVAKDSVQLNRQGDAALFEQLAENVHAGRGVVSQVFSQTQNFIDRSYAGTPPDVLFERAVSGQLIEPATEERSMLGFHAYFVLYPISLLLYLMSSSMALVVWQTAAYCGLLWVACSFVARRSGSLALALMFGMIVVVNPNWFLGIQGQFYPDRLFVCAGFVLMWALHIRARLWSLLLISLFLVVLNERAALIGGLLIGMHAVLFGIGQGAPARSRVVTLIGIAGLLLVYAFLAKKYILTNAYYSSYMPASLSHLMDRLADGAFSRGIARNLLNNAFLLIPALFAPRYFLMALVVLAPNIVGSIGGAEKVGWSTHYHSYYFPVLVFAAAAGFVNLYGYLRSRIKWVMPAFALLSVVSVVAQEAGAWSEMGKPSQWLSSSLAQYLAYQKGQPTGYELRKRISESFTPGTLISTNELGMALLHQQNSVAPFPMGLREADGILVDCSDLTRKVRLVPPTHADVEVIELLRDRFQFDARTVEQVFPGYCAVHKTKSSR